MMEQQIEETHECSNYEMMQDLRENYVTDFTSVAELSFDNAHLFADYIIKKDMTIALAILKELHSQIYQ